MNLEPIAEEDEEASWKSEDSSFDSIASPLLKKASNEDIYDEDSDVDSVNAEVIADAIIANEQDDSVDEQVQGNSLDEDADADADEIGGGGVGALRGPTILTLQELAQISEHADKIASADKRLND